MLNIGIHVYCTHIRNNRKGSHTRCAIVNYKSPIYPEKILYGMRCTKDARGFIYLLYVYVCYIMVLQENRLQYYCCYFFSSTLETPLLCESEFSICVHNTSIRNNNTGMHIFRTTDPCSCATATRRTHIGTVLFTRI